MWCCWMDGEKQSRELNSKVFEVAETGVRGGLFLFTGSTVATAILAFASMVIARLLGPDGYGLYSVCLIVPGLFLLFADFGVNSALVKYLAQFRVKGEKGRVANLIRCGFLFKLLMGLFLFLVCFLFSDLLALYVLRRPNLGFLVHLASLLIIFQVLFVCLNKIFVGLDRMERSAVISVLQSVVKVVLAPLLIILGFGIIGALVGHVASYVVAGVVGSLFVYRFYREYVSQGSELGFRFLGDLRFMVKFGFPLFSSALLLNFLRQFQMLVLAWFTSDFEIGNFRAASNFLSLLSVLTVPISTALFPAFSKFDLKRERVEVERFFRYSVKYVLLLVVSVALFVGVVSRDLVYLVYGRSFVLAPFYLTLLAVTYLYVGIAMVVNNFLNGIGRTDVTFRVSLLNVLVALPLVFVLTMFYGVPGLIVSMIVSGFASLMYGLRVVIWKFGIRFDVGDALKIYLAAFLSAIFASIVVFCFSSFEHLINLFLAAAVFSGSYLVLVPVVGAVKERDLNNLRDIFGRFRLLAPLVEILLRFEYKLLKLCHH